jgi:phosphatidylinositol alpha-1,6-mannosyltransferase
VDDPGPPGRLRQVAAILVFDLGGPLLAYALLRSAGLSAVAALVVSGVLPVAGIAVGALAERRLDVIGVMVLAGILLGTVLGLTSRDARLYLLEGSLPSAVFALACLFSVRLRRPLIFRLAVEILGPHTPKGRDVTAAWRYPVFRRAFQVITVTWGVGYLIEAAIRVVVVAQTSTGIALIFSKLVPYAFALVLSGWTLVYGEHEKKKAERAALYTRPVPRTLIVTNDFPPRRGGIQSFVHALATRLPEDTVIVYAPAWEGAAEFDARQPFPVIRHPTSLMLPVPAVSRRAAAIAREHGCDRVLFGAAAPLGLITPVLRKAGVTRAVALTHGHEAGWAALPGARGLLRRIGDEVDVVTYLGEYFRVRLARALSPAAQGRMARLAPGVDVTFFRPGAGGAAVRERLGLGGRPVVACVSRMVPRKGQDTLISAWPQVKAQVSDAVLLLVGDGPYAPKLRRLAESRGASDVIFTGPVPWPELPSYYDAADVFAMPCRTRRAGLDVEGLGIVYLEASATGLPVIGGDSGGAPDAILDGETGYVVRDVPGVAKRLVELLGDPAKARAMGEKGQAWVDREWREELSAARLSAILEG